MAPAAKTTAQNVVETISIRDACKIALVVPLYMRKLARDGKIQSHKDRDGRWRLVKSSVVAYAKARQDAEEARINRIRMGIESVPTRPTTASCARFRKRAAVDRRLTAADRQTVMQFIDRCEAYWDRAYKAAKAKGNGKG